MNNLAHTYAPVEYKRRTCHEQVADALHDEQLNHSAFPIDIISIAGKNNEFAPFKFYFIII